MFCATRENIGDQNTRFKFVKLCEVITILQSFDFCVYGSCVYEYIWRSAAACLPWKRYTTLEAIVQTKPVRINNINGYYRGLGSQSSKELVAFFKRIANVSEYPFQVKHCNFSEMSLSFFNPFDDCSYEVRIELASNSPNMPWICDDLITQTGFYKNEFILTKQSSQVKHLLETSFVLKNVDFSDVQTFGILCKIGNMISANSTIISTTNHDSHLGMAIGRIRALVNKGYRVIWRHSNLYIQIPKENVDEKCSVCMAVNCADPMSGVVTLPCRHMYHLKCLSTWCRYGQGNAPTCPLCRGSFDAQALKFW